MVAILRDCKGILLVDFKEVNTTIDGTYCVTYIAGRCSEKHREKSIEAMRLLHDNTPDHTSGVAQTATFKQIDHPPYNPEAIPSDYYLFGYCYTLPPPLTGLGFLTLIS